MSVMGIDDSKTFPTKAEAASWAAERETELRTPVTSGIVAVKTCDEAFERYAEEVSPRKRGARWEKVRLKACAKFMIDGKRLGSMLLKDIDTTIMALYRDLRLTSVKSSTVNREFNLLSNVFTVARQEWKWTVKKPIAEVKRPKDPKARNRLISNDEIEQLRIALGYNGSVRTMRHALFIAFLFAIETAMREGEIAALKWDNIYADYACVEKSKNGEERDVALSPEALRLLGTLPKKGPLCFNLSADYMSATFRKVRETTLIVNLRFHDTRHEATTRLARKLHVLELARMTGHRDLKQLMVYYNETASEIAKKL